MSDSERNDYVSRFEKLKQDDLTVWNSMPEASEITDEYLAETNVILIKVRYEQILFKVQWLSTLFEMHVNKETFDALAKMTTFELKTLLSEKGFGIVGGHVTTEAGPALHVFGTVTKPKWFKESLIWIDADPNAEFLVRLQEERVKFAALHGLNPNDEKYFPTAHLTIKFGIDPSAIDSIDRIHREIAACGPFKFADMVPLGPKGKENAWGLRTNDPTIYKLLSDAASDWLLSRDHAGYVSTNGWAKLPASEFAILPHITFVRNLPNFDITKPPAFEDLEDVVCKLSHLRLRVGIIGEQSGIKIKLIKDFPPYDGTN